MRAASFAIAVTLATTSVGCRDVATPTAHAAPDASIAADSDAARASRREALLAKLRAIVAAHPDDGAALYAIAQLEALFGRADASLDALARLDALGWDYPPDDDVFPGVRDTLRYREIAARFASREPRASTSTPAFTIAERGLVPEGIAFDPRSGTFYVSSIARRKVVAIDAQGRARDLVRESEHGLMEALGMKVDAARDLLWVASNDEKTGESGVFALNPSTGALRRRARLSGGHALNDLAFDERGSLFVTDTIGGGVYLMVPAVDTLLPYLEPGTFLYPNGIALSDAKTRIFVAHLDGIAVVDRTTKRIAPLAHDARVSLGGIDGLALHGNALYAIQNGLGHARVVRFDLDAAMTRVERATPLETANPAFQVPTTGVVANGAFVYVANSQLDVQGGAAEKMREAILLKTAL